LPPDSIDPTQLADFDALLIGHQRGLARLALRHGRGVLAFEAIDDLVQGMLVEALKSRGSFEYRGLSAFRGWLSTIGERHIRERARYWRCRKREAGVMLRVATSSGSSTFVPGAVDPPGSWTGPPTFAARREQFHRAMRAIALLPPRDQKIICAMAEGGSIADIARELSISYDAAERARLRSIVRFEKILGALEGSR
jgi:RNA polymerase sigma factor (sigma-70 family)